MIRLDANLERSTTSATTFGESESVEWSSAESENSEISDSLLLSGVGSETLFEVLYELLRNALRRVVVLLRVPTVQDAMVDYVAEFNEWTFGICEVLVKSEVSRCEEAKLTFGSLGENVRVSGTINHFGYKVLLTVGIRSKRGSIREDEDALGSSVVRGDGSSESLVD